MMTLGELDFTPAEFCIFAAKCGWRPEVIEQLKNPPFSKERFVMGDGKTMGAMVRIVPIRVVPLRK